MKISFVIKISTFISFEKKLSFLIVLQNLSQNCSNSNFFWSFFNIFLKFSQNFVKMFKKPPGNCFKNQENFLKISAVFSNTKNLSNIFLPSFRKMLISLKKLFYEKIFKPAFPTKKLVFIFVVRHPLPFERDLGPQNRFFRLFLREYSFFEKNC